MAGKTGIEWTDATWNPTTGCDKVSPGCDNCYALKQAKRLKAMGSARYQTDGDPKTSGPGFGIAMHPDALDWPLRKTAPLRIFVNSMSDLFHAGVTREFQAEVFAVMALAEQHTFQVLTKRPGVMRSVLSSPEFRELVALKIEERTDPAPVATWPWPLPNVWVGTSVEDQKRADLRIPALLDTPASTRFLSMEPLLGPVDLSVWLGEQQWPACWDEHSPTTDCGRCIKPDWIIVGGESGPGSRPMHPEWVRSIRDQCIAADVAFHFKQWGSWSPAGYENGTHLMQVTGQVITRKSGTTTNPYGHGSGTQDLVDRGHPGWVRVRPLDRKLAGRELDGRTWDEWPYDGTETFAAYRARNPRGPSHG